MMLARLEAPDPQVRQVDVDVDDLIHRERVRLLAASRHRVIADLQPARTRGDAAALERAVRTRRQRRSARHLHRSLVGRRAGHRHRGQDRQRRSNHRRGRPGKDLRTVRTLDESRSRDAGATVSGSRSYAESCRTPVAWSPWSTPPTGGVASRSAYPPSPRTVGTYDAHLGPNTTPPGWPGRPRSSGVGRVNVDVGIEAISHAGHRV